MSEPEHQQNEACEKRQRASRLRYRVIVAAGLALLIACGVRAFLQIQTEPVDARFVPPPGGHVMYLPTPQDVVERMLELAAVSKDDLVYDLGCGDGRVLVTAAKIYGCRCRGYDIDPLRVRDSLQNARRQGVTALVQVEQRDIFTIDLKLHFRRSAY